MAILNPTATNDVFDGNEKNFRGEARRLLISGPLVLYRLAGSKNMDGTWARDQEFGGWWFDSELLSALADDLLEAHYDGNREMRRNTLAGTRTDLAVLQKWSDMAWFCILKLKAGDSAWAWVGIAEQQKPDRGGGFYEGMLPGGGMQYFIPRLDRTAAAALSKQPTHAIMAKIHQNPGWRG